MKILLMFALLFSLQQPQGDTPIKVGTIIPATGPGAELGAASRAALKAYFDEINSQGGINGRKLELSVALMEADLAATSGNIKRLIADDRVVAFVGGIIAGRDADIAALVQTEAVPLIGPATLNPTTDLPLNRYAFYLISGLKEQARALVNFAAAKPELKKSPAAIIYLDDSLSTASASAAEEQARKLGWNGVSKSVQSGADFRAAEIVNDLKQKGAQAVFVFGRSATIKSLIEQSIQFGFAPTFFTTNASAGADSYAGLTPAFKDKFFLSFPTTPADIRAADEYRALQTKYQLPAKHLAAQLTTLAAAKVFVEALKRVDANSKLEALNSKAVPPSSIAGQRQKLIEALEGLKDFETGFSPRVTFARDRRIGAPGAYMVTFNPETKQLVPASGWIPSE